MSRIEPTDKPPFGTHANSVYSTKFCNEEYQVSVVLYVRKFQGEGMIWSILFTCEMPLSLAEMCHGYLVGTSFQHALARQC